MPRIDDEPQFVVRTELSLHPMRPDIIVFQLWSKEQHSSNPEKWYMSVAEFLEKTERQAPDFLLNAEGAESLAQDLLNVAAASRRALDK